MFTENTLLRGHREILRAGTKGPPSREQRFRLPQESKRTPSGEEDQVDHYLNAGTRQQFISKCEHVLIRQHAELMWESFQSPPRLQ